MFKYCVSIAVNNKYIIHYCMYYIYCDRQRQSKRHTPLILKWNKKNVKKESTMG